MNQQFDQDFFNNRSLKEIRAFYDEVRLNPIKTAQRLFPARLGGYVEATCSLGRYAVNKYVAECCWRRGDVFSARGYEKICGDIRAGLPHFAWF